MKKYILIMAIPLVITAGGACLLQTASSGPVVVDSPARADDGSNGDPMPLGKIDHSAWGKLLKKYVDDDGMVDYRAWKKSPEDMKALKEYLGALSRADPEAQTTKEGKLAFWINAYNALTVHGILDVYPTTSIRNHTAAVVGYNIWDDLLLPVGDKQVSLNDIEHKILRKLGEPRIHFAIVCASIGCPRLRNEAYTAADLETQLADNTRDFFSRERNLQVNPERRVVSVSSILDWFGEDFAPAPEQGLERLAEYMPEQASQLIKQGDFAVKYLEYDWNLNQQ